MESLEQKPPSRSASQELEAFVFHVRFHPGDMRLAKDPGLAKRALDRLLIEGMSLEEILIRTGHPKFGGSLLYKIVDLYLQWGLAEELKELLKLLEVQSAKLVPAGSWPEQAVWEATCSCKIARLILLGEFRRAWDELIWAKRGKGGRPMERERMEDLIRRLYRVMVARGVIKALSPDREEILTSNLWLVGRRRKPPAKAPLDITVALLTHFHARSSEGRLRRKERKMLGLDAGVI